MTRIVDRPFDWVAASAFVLGAAVIVPSVLAVLTAVASVIRSLF